MAELAAKTIRIRTDIAADAPLLAPPSLAPSLAPSSSPAAEPPIDRAHLARMTHGERDLECEVLQLYAAQADLLLGRMRPGDQEASPSSAIAALAHTLNGSSRGIGAWQVADAAAAVEADAAQGRDMAASVERLSAAIRAAQADIAALMRG